MATKNATHAMVGVQVQDSDRQMLAFHTTQTTQPFSGTSDWKQFTLRFPVPMRTGHIAILAMHQGRGEVWFDDFRLVLVTPGG